MLALCVIGCADSNMPRLSPPPTLFPRVDPNWSSGLDALFLYSYAFCIIMIAACFAVLFWVQIPSIRRWAWMGLTFAGTIIAMGLTFSIIKPFIPWLVLAGVACGVAVGVWAIIANFDTLRQLIHKEPEELTKRARNLVDQCQK